MDTLPVAQVTLCRGSATGVTVPGQVQTLLGHHNPPHAARQLLQVWVSCPALGELLSACAWPVWEGSSSLSAPTLGLTLSLSPGGAEVLASVFRVQKNPKLPIQPRGELDKPSTSCLTPAGATLLTKLLCWGK